MRAAFVILLLTAAVALGAQPQPEDVKTDAAAAHHRHHQWRPYPYFQPLVQDRFVCDLDASVLLVVDSNRHHHHHRHAYYGGAGPSGANRAVRVKCSEVANNDEDSCNLCCQQTARRDTTLANEKLFGFLAITKIKDDETFTRSKRAADGEFEEEEDREEDEEEGRRRRGGGGAFQNVDPTYVIQGKWTPDEYKTNVKCVCCAPRTAPPAQSPPSSSYGNAAGSPPAAAAPYGANTFSAQQQPQPLVDSWQSDASSWGAASDAAPAAAPAATPAPVNSY